LTKPKDLLALPPKAEAIFLVLEEGAEPRPIGRPSPSRAGPKIVGDIVTPAIAESAWTMN